MRTCTWLLILVGCSEPVPTEPIAIPDCITFSPGASVGQVPSPPAIEISGLAVSDDAIWVHNDGGPPEIYALNLDGSLRSTWTLEGVVFVDLEDMARAPGPDGRPWLYLADIGDNAMARTMVRVFRFPEPDSSTDGVIPVVERLDLTYPDGPRDAETLLVDPVDGTLWIVSKEPDGESGFYRILRPGPGPQVLERALQMTFGVPPLGQTSLVTGGDLDARGLILRTYLTEAYLWVRGVDEPVIEALKRDPCPVTLVGEPQAEAIGWGPDGLYTISEGLDPDVNVHGIE